MNNTTKKIISIILCTSLVAGTVGAGVYSLASNEKSSTSTARVAESETESSETQAVEKDETVYVLAQSDGTARKVIVSDWLKNMASAQSITDISCLENIENVKGDETFSAGESSITWDSQGSDIYYSGTTENELPVTMKISYKLDGKDIAPPDISGKSGKVTIRFDYTNNTHIKCKIADKETEVCVPFAMLTGTILDNSVFRNVEVKNGKIINDGIRTVVAGFAFPGIQESLAIDREKFEIPEYFEITADVTDFKMGMTATLATNELFSNIDLDKLGETGDLNDSITQLSTAMTQLTDGSSSLYDGLNTLVTSTASLKDGSAALVDGSKKLSDGAASLSSGAADLQAGTAKLSGGLSTLDENSETLNGGAKQVFESLLSTATTQINASGANIPQLTIENYSTVLDGVIASLGEPYNQSVIALKTQLDSYNSFYTGLLTYTAGVGDAASGASDLDTGALTLKAGAAELSAGAAELNSGLVTFNDNIPALVDGITQLRDGAQQLSDGIKQFNDDGISKIVNAVNGDISGIIERIGVLKTVSQSYKCFSGISDDMNGQVKFFFRTDAIA